MSPKNKVNLRQVVRDNCIALFRHEHQSARRMSWSAFAADCKIGNGTAQRINEMTADPALSTLESIADRYGLQAWHVLLPLLDPKNPPVFLMTDAERQLYEALARDAEALMRRGSTYQK